jgi:hypothetical protein
VKPRLTCPVLGWFRPRPDVTGLQAVVDRLRSERDEAQEAFQEMRRQRDDARERLDRQVRATARRLTEQQAAYHAALEARLAGCAGRREHIQLASELGHARQLLAEHGLAGGPSTPLVSFDEAVLLPPSAPDQVR